MQTLAHDGTKLKPILRCTYTRKKNRYGGYTDWVTSWREKGRTIRSFICNYGLSQHLTYDKNATKLHVQVTVTQPKNIKNVFILGIHRVGLLGGTFMEKQRYSTEETLIDLETVCLNYYGNFIADEINLCPAMKKRIASLLGGHGGTIFVEFEEV